MRPAVFKVGWRGAIYSGQAFSGVKNDVQAGARKAKSCFLGRSVAKRFFFSAWDDRVTTVPVDT